MAVLNGINARDGEGMVIEVHLDIVDAPPEFLSRLNQLGFENDPFLDFHPNQYKCHYTGRTRAAKSEMNQELAAVNALIDQVLQEAVVAGVDLYVESELVREIHHFDRASANRSLTGLDDLIFEPSGSPDTAKADVHVEFRRGTVPSNLYDHMVDKHFYWVVTPASDKFPSEEIATLQTSTFHEAALVFNNLVEFPLPACTGIHLEQKLRMIGSRPGISLPGVVRVAFSPGICVS